MAAFRSPVRLLTISCHACRFARNLQLATSCSDYVVTALDWPVLRSLLISVQLWLSMHLAAEPAPNPDVALIPHPRWALTHCLWCPQWLVNSIVLVVAVADSACGRRGSLGVLGPQAESVDNCRQGSRVSPT